MKLFKNPVGRPPKDLKKKRAITVLVIALVILLGGTIATINILGINVSDLMGNSTSKGKNIIITYDSNGGTGAMGPTTQTKAVKGKTKIKLLKNTFKKEGYEFVGWIQKNKLCLVNQTCCNDDKCLYYQGKRDATYANFKGKQTVSLPNIIKKNRESFVYNRMVEGTKTNKKRYLNLIKDGSTVEINANMNLVAVWARTFTIEYEANGGQGKMSDQEIQYKNPTRITKNTFTKKGYLFAGWKLKNKETGMYRGCTDANVCNTTNPTRGWHNASEIKNFVLYKDGVSVSTTTKPGKTIIFEATWEKDTRVKVTFNANGGKLKENGKNTNVTKKTIAYKQGEINKVQAYRSGYTFGGWYTNKNCKGAIPGVTYGKKISVAKDTTVYACWSKNATKKTSSSTNKSNTSSNKTNNSSGVVKTEKIYANSCPSGYEQTGLTDGGITLVCTKKVATTAATYNRGTQFYYCPSGYKLVGKTCYQYDVKYVVKQVKCLSGYKYNSTEKKCVKTKAATVTNQKCPKKYEQKGLTDGGKTLVCTKTTNYGVQKRTYRGATYKYCATGQGTLNKKKTKCVKIETKYVIKAKYSCSKGWTLKAGKCYKYQ